MPSLIDPALQEEFLRDGYVTLRLLSEEQAAACRASVAAVHGEGAWVPNHAETANYLSELDASGEVKLRLGDALGAMLEPAIERHFCDFRVLMHTLFVKPAPGDPTVMHQHVPLSDTPFDRNIVIWCALSDCEADSGALYVIPRSHHLYRFIRTYEAPDFFDGYRDELIARHALRLSFKAGEAVVMDHSLLHGADANRGAQPRLASASVLLAPDAQHLIYRRANKHTVALKPSLPAGADGEGPKAGLQHTGGTAHSEFPAWWQDATLAQTEALLAAAGPRASMTHDPLETVAHLGPRAPAAGRVRALVRKLPGASRAANLLRRVAAKMRDQRA